MPSVSLESLKHPLNYEIVMQFSQNIGSVLKPAGLPYIPVGIILTEMESHKQLVWNVLHHLSLIKSWCKQCLNEAL